MLPAIARFPHRYFTAPEYISADSAYACTETVIPVYKKPKGTMLTKDEDNFNYMVSIARVLTEHCYGILKGKWQSLRDLRFVLNDISDNERVNDWIDACLILHNLTLDDWVEAAWLDGNGADDDDGNGLAVGGVRDGKTKRAHLCAFANGKA